MVEDQDKTVVHFTVECHGILRSEKDGAAATFVSSHWIKSCLEVFECVPLKLFSCCFYKFCNFVFFQD